MGARRDGEMDGCIHASVSLDASDERAWMSHAISLVHVRPCDMLCHVHVYVGVCSDGNLCKAFDFTISSNTYQQM